MHDESEIFPFYTWLCHMTVLTNPDDARNCMTVLTNPDDERSLHDCQEQVQTICAEQR